MQDCAFLATMEYMIKIKHPANKILRYMLTGAISLVSLALIVGLASISIRGQAGNPTPEEIFQDLRSEGKPFENSPERGRYALTMAIVDNRSTSLTKEMAKFVVPDLGYKDGKFVSLFAPGVSYLVAPIYKFGQSLGYAQVSTFSLSTVFALLNTLLVFLITRRLKMSRPPAIVAALTFLFGSTAWVYAGTLYQHHMTTFLLLCAVYVLASPVRRTTSFLVGVIAGLSFFIEYPNLLFFAPLVLFTLAKHLNVSTVSARVKVSFDPIAVLGIIGFVLAMVPTLLYNKEAYGSYAQLAGTVQSIRDIDLDPNKVDSGAKSAAGFFQLYNMPRSMEVLLTSQDRGILWFSPVYILSVLGIVGLWKTDKTRSLLLLGPLFAIFLLYGTWGDPWGGWAYGSRYLIPAFALLAVFLGVSLERYGRKMWFIPLFLVAASYSVWVSLLGALTTIQVPPSVETESALRYPKVIYLHSYEMIKTGKSGSFLFNTYIKNYVSLENFMWLVLAAALTVIFGYYVWYVFQKNENK